MSSRCAFEDLDVGTGLAIGALDPLWRGWRYTEAFAKGMRAEKKEKIDTGIPADKTITDSICEP